MIRNLTKKTIISKKPLVATHFFQRGFGMIGRQFSDFDAMIFHNCASIHTMFMSMSIDVIFLDKDNRACEIRKELDSWRPFVSSPGAVTVIELPCGTVEASCTEKGDILDLNAELSKEEQEKMVNKMVVLPDTAIPMSMENKR